MQRTTSRGKKTQNTSFVKGVVLLFVLIAVFLFYKKMRTTGLPPQVNSMLSSEFENYRNLREIDSTISDSLKRNFAGFWVHQVGDSSSPVKITDHLELKDNGIIWQVIRWDLRFLNSDSVTMFCIRHSYLYPYSMSSDTDDVICDTRIIRQCFVIGNDTCYGESQVNLMWRAKKMGEEFELNKSKYKRYGGQLQNFFPDGAIDIVDDINISKCRNGSALTPYAKSFLVKAFTESSAGILPDNRSLIYEYYDKFLKNEMIESLPVISSIPANIPLVLKIQPDGNVTNVSISDRIVAQSKLEELVLKEAYSWKFPLRQSQESSVIKYLLTF